MVIDNRILYLQNFPLLNSSNLTPFGLPLQGFMQFSSLTPKRIVESDLLAFANWRVTRPFTDALKEALGLDLREEKFERGAGNTVDLKLERKELHRSLKPPKPRPDLQAIGESSKEESYGQIAGLGRLKYLKQRYVFAPAIS